MTAEEEDRRRFDGPDDFRAWLEENQDSSTAVWIELAIAFVIRHPSVTSAIIGPRTMEQLTSQLPAADTVLSNELLDRIDDIVAPGTTINPDDNSYGAAELAPNARRR